MNVIIISDSHGNIVNLKHVLGFLEKVKIEALVHCGDWNSIKAIETVLESKIPLYTVLGNADIDPEVGAKLQATSKKFAEKVLEFEIDQRKISVVHNIKDYLLSSNLSDIVFYGHTHRQLESNTGGVRIVNPGALENRVEFAVYDTIQNKVEFIYE